MGIPHQRLDTLFVTLTFGRSYYHSEMQRKTSFPFAFRSFIRTFAAKINKYVFKEWKTRLSSVRR